MMIKISNNLINLKTFNLGYMYLNLFKLYNNKINEIIH